MKTAMRRAQALPLSAATKQVLQSEELPAEITGPLALLNASIYQKNKATPHRSATLFCLNARVFHVLEVL